MASLVWVDQLPALLASELSEPASELRVWLQELLLVLEHAVGRQALAPWEVELQKDLLFDLLWGLFDSFHRATRHRIRLVQALKQGLRKTKRGARK